MKHFVKPALVAAICIQTMLDAATSSAATNSVPILKVYLEAGQSNADGRAVTNGLSVNLLQPQASVPFYYYLTGGAVNGDGTLGTLTTLRPGCSAIGGGTTFGPEVTFGNMLASYYAVSNGVATNQVMVALIKYAHGGTSLVSDWAATGLVATNGDGPDYRIFQRVVTAGLAKLAAAYPAAQIELDGMIWVQGETDIDDGVSSATAYGTNLIRFISDVRLKFATNQPYGSGLPFFFSRISAQQTYYSLPSDASYSNYLRLRAGQNYVAATMVQSNVFMLDIDGSQFTTLTPYSSPGLHFDTAGQQALGTAFAQAVRSALPPSLLLAPVKTAGGWTIPFLGVSGTRQSLLQATALAGPWTFLTNTIMNASGSTSFVDPTATGATSFFKLSRP